MRFFLFLLLLPLALAAPALAQNPHARFAEPDGCAECHVVNEGEKTPAQPVVLNADVISVCLKCHDRKMVFGTHPVEIKPEMKLPEGVHLSEGGVMTCATCHDPHMKSEGDSPCVAQPFAQKLLSLVTFGKKYKTYFLRQPNESGQLCNGCHRMDEVGKKRAPLMETLRVEEFVGSDACARCHVEIYKEWKKTPHARMVGDAKKSPETVRADFSSRAPFGREVVALSLGSHWSQRYVEEVEGELYVKGAGWN
ncbi:hypothetical protein FDZ71_13030, partial [bacterium]